MNNKTMLQKFIGVWNTKTIVGVAVGAALFGVLMVYGSIRVFTNTSLTTAMIVPVIVGGLFGPLPAAVAAGASPSLGVSGSVVGIALIFSLACDIILASFSAALLLIRFSIVVAILR